MPRPVVVWAPTYRGNSAGVRALYVLARELAARGADVRVRDTGGETGREPCPWPVAMSEDVPAGAVVVYPEITAGNPAGADRVVRWLLNRDRHPEEPGVRYSWLPAIGPGFPTLHVDPVEPGVFTPKAGVGAGCAYYVGKGVFDPAYVPPGAAEITPGWPATRTDLADLLRRVDRVVSFDPLCALNVEAALCGTPVDVVYRGSGWGQSPVAGTPFDLPGVTHHYGPGDFDAVGGDPGTAHEVYRSRAAAFAESVDRFLADIRRLWP